MIYYHADDYGINPKQSKRILSCRKNGPLNSVSILPTSDHLGETIPLLDPECKKSVHINLCEGRALSDPKSISMLANGEGCFYNSFGAMLIKSVFFGKELEKQVEKECYAQISRIGEYLPEDYKLRLDSHRHYHMIPRVFRGLLKAAFRTGREIEYIRFPMESPGLYLSIPRLWSRISPLSIIKALVLNTLGSYNKLYLRKCGLSDRTLGYIGVVFTDRMFYENIAPLVELINSGKFFKGQDVEVQFHPGKVKRGEPLHETRFANWYSSINRDKEAAALKRFAEDIK